MLQDKLSLTLLETVVAQGAGYATTCALQPVQGVGGIVKPPTFAKTSSEHPYNAYERMVEGVLLPCVSLNSIGAEANCMEEAIQEALDGGTLNLSLPVLMFDPVVEGLSKVPTSQMGHRSCDARLLHSEIDGVSYRESEIGSAILNSTRNDMNGVLRWAPLDLMFGMWDSHDFSTKAALRAKVHPSLKIARLITAEVHGININIRDSGAQLAHTAGFSSDFPLKEGYKDGMFDELKANDGKEASGAGFAQVPAYNVNCGGVSMQEAWYEANFSAGLLRSYKFPDATGKRTPERDKAARTLMTALTLLVQTVRLESGFYLRSGCDLVPEHPPVFTFYGLSRQEVLFQGPVDVGTALQLFELAEAAASTHGIQWGGETVSVVASEGFQKRLAAHLTWSGAEGKKSKKSEG